MIDWVVPHQANRRIIETTAERLGLPLEKVMFTIQKYGNTTTATIPLCLWDYEQKLKVGDRLLLAAFGGGFTWGGAYLTWAYDGAKRAEAQRQGAERKGLADKSPCRQLSKSISSAKSACSRAASRRCRAGAGGRSSASDPRSSPSTARSSRPCAPPQTAR